MMSEEDIPLNALAGLETLCDKASKINCLMTCLVLHLHRLHRLV